MDNIKQIVEIATKKNLKMIHARKSEKIIRKWSPELKQLKEKKRRTFRKSMNEFA